MQQQGSHAPEGPCDGAKEEALEVPSDLEVLEKELTAQVPQLLESMNVTSGKVNTFELQLVRAQASYKRLLEQWSSLYEDLRGEHGVAINRVRPYFDAAQTLGTASHRVQCVVREFSAASSLHAQAKAELRSMEEDLSRSRSRGGRSSEGHEEQLLPMQRESSGSRGSSTKVSLDELQQDGLARATVRVLQCQQERDFREQEYARALQEFQGAQQSLEAWRLQIGDAMIKRMLPSFRELQKHQATLAEEQSRINALTERIRLSKVVYHNSMRELDKISEAVHTARKDFAGGASSQATPRQRPPEPPEEATNAVRACPSVPPEEAPETMTPIRADMGAGDRLLLEQGTVSSFGEAEVPRVPVAEADNDKAPPPEVSPEEGPGC